MTKKLLFITLITTLIGISASADEKEITVDQIIEKANFTAYYQGSDGQARITMDIVDSQGRKRHREMTILRWDSPKPKSKSAEESDKTESADKAESSDKASEKSKEFYAGKQKFYVFFHKPADVEKMAFLVWKQLDKDDDRWLYLPKLDLVKRIAGGEKRTSFVGSNFFYEDISGRNIDYDKHELLDTTKSYYVLKSTPKDAKSVAFSYYKTWVHRKTFLVIKTEYYDKADKAYRRYDVKAVKQIQGYWTVTKSRMADLRTSRYTDITYSTVKYDVDIPENIFTERYLRKAPTKYLKN